MMAMVSGSNGLVRPTAAAVIWGWAARPWSDINAILVRTSGAGAVPLGVWGVPGLVTSGIPVIGLIGTFSGIGGVGK